MAAVSMSRPGEPNGGSISTRPKRKRAPINYYEGELKDDDMEEVDEDDDSYDEIPSSKKAKSKTTSKAAKAVKKADRPPSKKKIFPFLQLPAEIRNLIYKEALIDDNGIYLVPSTVHYRRIAERADPHIVERNFRDQLSPRSAASEEPLPYPRRLVPTLLAVNKQIHQEAHAILYNNEFVVSDMQALHAFVMGLSQRCRDLLERITIESWGFTRGNKSCNHSSLTVLSFCTNITKLNFNCRTYNYGPELTARQIYRDGFHWLEAVGRAKGKKDAAVDCITVHKDNLAQPYWSKSRGTAPTEEENLATFRSALRRLLTEDTKLITSGSRGKKKAKMVYAD